MKQEDFLCRHLPQKKTELLATYGADANRGLTEAQAQKNKEQYGANALTRRKPDTLLKRLWDAATEPMLLMLIAAGLIALAVNIVRRVTGGEADFWSAWACSWPLLCPW